MAMEKDPVNLSTVLSSKEQNILENYQADLEQIQELVTLASPAGFDWATCSAALRFKMSIEYNALCKISQDHITDRFANYVQETSTYLLARIAQAKNNLLKAKYLHFLYCLEGNYIHGCHAIDQYQMALSRCLESKNDKNRHIKCKVMLEVIIQLSNSLSYRTAELKQQIRHYLTSKDSYPRLKTWIIMAILNVKLFKAVELDYLPQLCIELAKKESDYRFIELNLEQGLEIATKLQDLAKQQVINELLGDNEYKQIREYDGRDENLVIPHYNNNTYIKIIQYYKNAKNLDKQHKAIGAYNQNKKLCKFLKITSTVKTTNPAELNQKMEALFLSIVGSSTRKIVAHLISGAHLFFAPYQLLDSAKEENFPQKEEEKETADRYKLMVNDINNNSQTVNRQEHFAFSIYSNCLYRTIDFTTDIILTGLQGNKLSYLKVARILSTFTYFGQQMTITRNGEQFSYTWMDMIDIGLKDFFKQFDLLLKNKAPDWRFAIDFLSLKFEGILRDIIALTDGVITKVSKNGDTTDLLLDDLLRSGAIEKVFTKDDCNLFKYIFTGKGHNLRHNVAHSFYKPHDYTREKAMMVFLAILRLATFAPIQRGNDVQEKTNSLAPSCIG